MADQAERLTMGPVDVVAYPTNGRTVKGTPAAGTKRLRRVNAGPVVGSPAFAHDVEHELRAPDGKWTGHGGSGHDLAEMIKERHPDVEMSLSQRGKNLRVSLIRTPESQRGQGKAGAAMRDLAAEADKHGVRLTLSPEPLHGDRKTSKAKLTAWYKSLGFVENKGRNKDYEISDAMYREPQGAGLNASGTIGLLAYGLTPLKVATDDPMLLAAGAYSPGLSWELQMERAHAGCHVSAFCRNPLHPGPCKGWKHHLGLVSPGALHALEKIRHEQLERKRQSKVQALKDAGKAIPKSLQTPIVYDPAKNPHITNPDKITPGLGIPTKGLTPETAKATLEKIPTKAQVGEKLNAKHAPEAAAAGPSEAQKAAEKMAGNYSATLDKKLAVYAELTPEEYQHLSDFAKKSIHDGLKSAYQYNPTLRKDIAAVLAKFTTGSEKASWEKAAAHPGYTPNMEKVGKYLLTGGKASQTLSANKYQRLDTYGELTPEEFGNLHPQEKNFVMHELDNVTAKDGPKRFQQAKDIKAKLSAKAQEPGPAPAAPTTKVPEPEAAAAVPKPTENPTYLTIAKAGLKDGDKVFLHGKGKSTGPGQLVTVRKAGKTGYFFEDAQGNKVMHPHQEGVAPAPVAGGAASKWLLSPAPGKSFPDHAASPSGPTGFEKGEQTKMDNLHKLGEAQKKANAQIEALIKVHAMASGHHVGEKQKAAMHAKASENAQLDTPKKILPDGAHETSANKIAAKLWAVKGNEAGNLMHQGDLEKALAQDIHDGVDDGKPTPVLDAARDAAVTLGQDKPGAMQALADAVHAKLGISGQDDTPAPFAPEPVAPFEDISSVTKPHSPAFGNPNAGAAPHVQEAIAYANGHKAATDTKKLAAYEKLSHDELASLDPNTQKLMAANLAGMQAKFLKADKKNAAGNTLAALQVAQGGGAGAGGSSAVSTPTAGVVGDLTKNKVKIGALSAAVLNELGGNKVADSSAFEPILEQAHKVGAIGPLSKEFADQFATAALAAHGGTVPIHQVHPHLSAEMAKLIAGDTSGATPLTSAVMKSKVEGNNGPLVDAIKQHPLLGGAGHHPTGSFPSGGSQAGAGGGSTHVSPVAPSGPSVPNSGGDIDSFSDGIKNHLFSAYKSAHKGTVLSAPIQDQYDNLVAVAHHYAGEVIGYSSQPGKSSLIPGDLSVAQVAKVVDEGIAKHLGKPNQNVLENKILGWLQTPEGTAYANSHKVDESLARALAESTESAKAIKLPPGEKVQKVAGPGKYDPNKWSSDFRALKAADMQESQDNYMKATGTDWSHDQVTALANYTTGSYYEINSYLRGVDRHGAPVTDVADLAKDRIKLAQSAMRPLQQDTLLKRGTGFEQFPVKMRSADGLKAAVGKTFKEPAFMSTTVAGEGGNFDNKVMLHIEAPTGTQAAWVKHISHNEHENEVVLAAGSKFRIVSVDTDPNGTVNVLVRVVS